MTRILARLARIARQPGRGTRPRPWRVLAPLATVITAAAAVSACTDAASLGGTLTDQVPPVVEITPAGAPSDTSLAFDVLAADNLGLLNVRVTVSGPGVNATFDTTFTSAVGSTTLSYVLDVPSSIPPGTLVTVIANAVDGAHNSARPDTAFLGVGGLSPAVVLITAPRATDTAVVGFSLGISISGKSEKTKVKALGYMASGVFATPIADSLVFSSPLLDSTAVDTTLSLVGASAGTLTLTPFLLDSLNRRVVGPPVNVLVLTSAGSNTVPVVDFGLTDRIEVQDTVHVDARDLAGIRWLGYEVYQLPSAGGALIAADSFQVAGLVSSTFRTFTMSLPITTFPTDVVVKAFARNTNDTRAYALLGDKTTVRGDTVTVVAGLTRRLPLGGGVADALFHAPTDQLILSNIEKNELEVFSLVDSSFKTPIRTGSRPWGLAARPIARPDPSDPTAGMSDTVLVALSGATHISKVVITPGGGQEVSRYPLPNIIAYSVTTTLSETSGQPIQERTVYDFSDRPQYLAATCEGPATGPAPCGDLIVVYSTTPTPGQTMPFPNKGTVRWENLTDSTSHFFFEQAVGQSAGRSDTLEVERFGAQGVGAADSMLVPFKQDLGGGVSYSIVVRVDELGFRDTTFVRNSGNYRRVILGEGGPVLGSRAMMYDVTSGFITQLGGVPIPVPVIDDGISRPGDVRDIIANANARVGGVAINFDGELGAIRGDSTYLVDRTLRLQGTLETSGGGAGFDFHPRNAGIDANGAGLGTGYGFSASNEPQIEVYDTHFYNRCMIIPTRDPVIGPIKAAVRGTNVVLIGATARGVVIVSVPDADLQANCP